MHQTTITHKFNAGDRVVVPRPTGNQGGTVLYATVMLLDPERVSPHITVKYMVALDTWQQYSYYEDDLIPA
jgi:hypothetical protein